MRFIPLTDVETGDLLFVLREIVLATDNADLAQSCEAMWRKLLDTPYVPVPQETNAVLGEAA